MEISCADQSRSSESIDSTITQILVSPTQTRWIRHQSWRNTDPLETKDMEGSLVGAGKNIAITAAD